MALIGLEACSLTAWLQAALSDAGIPAICIEARCQATGAMGAMPKKTDRKDARGEHLGLTPRRNPSGESDVQGRIRRCGDELARTALYDAPDSLLIRSTQCQRCRLGA